MSRFYDTILWDLDGTVFESGEGILQTARETLAHFHWPEPENLRPFVGPPSHESYERIVGMPHELALQAGNWHRARYLAGNWRMSRFFPGIPELLRDLRQAGAKLSVASTKPRPAMEAMMEAFSLWNVFDFFACAKPDGTGGEKPELIHRALEALGEHDKSRAVMIGDTRYDAAGARDAGVPFIGVLYGYGTREDMEEQGAHVFAKDTEELRALLIG